MQFHRRSLIQCHLPTKLWFHATLPPLSWRLSCRDNYSSSTTSRGLSPVTQVITHNLNFKFLTLKTKLKDCLASIASIPPANNRNGAATSRAPQNNCLPLSHVCFYWMFRKSAFIFSSDSQQKKENFFSNVTETSFCDWLLLQAHFFVTDTCLWQNTHLFGFLCSNSQEK